VSPSPARIGQMRLAVEADDHDAAMPSHRGVLGTGQELQVHGDGDQRR
jgi:hypothetical protein